MNNHMSLVSYIASRFNRHRTLPGSLKAMRIIAICGIAIATATLIVTLSILNGFEREYRRSILDFNAHVVLMRAGEIDEKGEAMALVDACRLSADDRAYIDEHGTSVAVWTFLYDAYRGIVRWHERLFEHAPVGSLREDVLRRIQPRGVAALLPRWIKAWHQRMRAIDRRGVVGATPFIYREGLVIAGGTIKGVIVKGVDARTLAQVNPMKITLAAGDAPLADALGSAPSSRNAVLGIRLAEQLAVDPERTQDIKLLVPTGAVKHGSDNFDDLTAVGSFESGLYDYDAQFMLMSLIAVRSLFAMPDDKITGIELKLDDPAKAPQISAWLEDRLRGSWRVIPWNELNADIFRAVQMEKRTFSIIVGIVVVVAAFNIVGVLLLIILMRSHEIALLRALGMTQRHLTRVFTRGGVTIGVIGVAVGVVAGVALALLLSRFEIIHIAPEIYFLSRLPIDISPALCGMIAFFCMIVCWGTSRVAAKKLAAVPISEGLQKGY